MAGSLTWAAAPEGRRGSPDPRLALSWEPQRRPGRRAAGSGGGEDVAARTGGSRGWRRYRPQEQTVTGSVTRAACPGRGRAGQRVQRVGGRGGAGGLREVGGGA